MARWTGWPVGPYLNLESTYGTYSLPPVKQQLGQCLIEDGADVETIADEVRCTPRMAFNYKRNLRDNGTCLAPSISRKGRPSILTEAMIEVQLMCSLKSIS